MSRRKGELSSKMIDAGWPHQVAIPAEDVQGAGYHPRHDHTAFPSLCVRGHWFRKDDREYVVLCFSDPEDAEKFKAQFGGEMIAPKDRPRWPGRR